MTVNVSGGYANIEGAIAIEEEIRTLNLEASSSFDRIDRVVLRLNDNIDSRKIDLYIIKGNAEQNPVAPPIIRNDSVYDLSLATIYINANSTSISQSKITDTRLDSNVCGLVAQAVNGIDTSELYKQMMNDLKELEKAISEAKIEQIVDGAVSTSKIVDGAVTQEKISNKSISFEKLNDLLKEIITPNYTIKEVWTGKYRKGKKVYYNEFEDVATQGGNRLINHGIGIEEYISINGTFDVAGEKRVLPFFDLINKVAVHILKVDSQTMTVKSDYTIRYETHLKVEYTKLVES